jgi:NADH-quinone oxidoreductase subunit J
MMLGPVEPQLLAATAVLPSPLTLAQSQAAAHGDTLPAALSPALLVTICLVAAAGTFLLLPGRRAAASRSVGGVLLLFAGILLAFSLVRFVVGQDQSVDLYFWSFAVIAILGALRVVTHARPVYAALYFVLTVFATAGLFILLWAEFMAAALVLIYAGAILVTYVFVIMLAASSARVGVDKLGEYDAVSREPLVAAAVGFALMGVLLFVILDRASPVAVGDRTYTYVAERVTGDQVVVVEDEVRAADAAAAAERVPAGLRVSADRPPVEAYSVQALGRYLFRAQGINLELAGLLLTLGMVGAILIARRRVIVPDDAASGPRELTAPATPVSDDPFSIPVYGTDNPRQKAYPET